MKNGKLRKIQIVLASVLYALSCLAAYHCSQARREPITRKAVAFFDGLFMLGTVIAAYYLIRWIAQAVRRLERSGAIVGAASGGTGGARTAGRTESSEGFQAGSLYTLFEKHGKLKLFLVMFAIGMVFTCAKYPGIESGGIKYAYQQAMGMDSLVRDLAPVKYPGSYITGHHPVVMTVLFGLFIKAGKAVGHINWGSFALSIVICAFNSWGLS